MSAETFTSHSDDFETTWCTDPCEKKVAQTPEQLCHFKDRTRFCPMPIVTCVTPGTVYDRISDAAMQNGC